MANKHTQAPWFHVWNGHYWDIQNTNKVHAPRDVHISAMNFTPRGEADARLVAAAPELLSALEGMFDIKVTMKHRKKVARAAIKKAKGEQK